MSVPAPGAPAPQKRSQRVTETSDLVAWITRLLHIYGDRIGDDPVALTHLRELESTLTQQANRGIFTANNGTGKYSQREIARMLGCSQPAILKRIRQGEIVHATEMMLRGLGPVVRLAEVRQRRARLLAAAEVEDRTGSVRELKAVGE